MRVFKGTCSTVLAAVLFVVMLLGTVQADNKDQNKKDSDKGKSAEPKKNEQKKADLSRAKNTVDGMSNG